MRNIEHDGHTDHLIDKLIDKDANPLTQTTLFFFLAVLRGSPLSSP